jgi:hypothetical protein
MERPELQNVEYPWMGPQVMTERNPIHNVYVTVYK